MRFHVNIEIDVADDRFQPQMSLSDASPEVIEALLAEALKPDQIRWACITKIPEHVGSSLQ